MKRIIVFLWTALLVSGWSLSAEGQTRTKVRIIERTTADTNVIIRQGDTVVFVRESTDIDSFHVQLRRFDISAGPHGVMVKRSDYAKKKRLLTRFLLLDIGFAGFLSDGSFNLPAEQEYLDLRYGKSRNINLQLFVQRVQFADRHMNFSYGLMFEFNKYRLQNDIRLLEGTVPLAFEITDEELRKNKLKAAYLYLPLMLGVESNPERFMRSFRVRAGIYAGILTNSKQKLIAEITDREKNKDDFNLNKFRYGFRGEIGYGLVNFYVHYSFAPMFKDGQGPDLQPLNMGLMLLPF